MLDIGHVFVRKLCRLKYIEKRRTRYIVFLNAYGIIHSVVLKDKTNCLHLLSFRNFTMFRTKIAIKDVYQINEFQ